MDRRKTNIASRLWSTPPETDINQFKQSLEQFTLYLVEVSFRKGNPIHLSVLATGFRSGGYWELWNNAGENKNLTDLASWPRYIKVIRPLGSIKERELDK